MPLLEHDVPSYTPPEAPAPGNMSDETADVSKTLGSGVHRFVAFKALLQNTWRRMWVRQPAELPRPSENDDAVTSWGPEVQAMADRARAALDTLGRSTASTEEIQRQRDALEVARAEEAFRYGETWQTTADRWAKKFGKGLRFSAEMYFGYGVYLQVKGNGHVQRIFEVAERAFLADDPAAPLIYFDLEKQLFYPSQLLKPYVATIRALLESFPQPEFLAPYAEAREIVERERRLLLGRLAEFVSMASASARVPGER